ncbi:hypothetical protein [Megasphaera sp.]|uniref:hypothetical protein n=1 Tax=Megasphaera sp. TaxID=2023260 RepID=UPI00352103DB
MMVMKPEKAGNDFIEHLFCKASLSIFLSLIILLMSGCGGTNSFSSTTSNTHKTKTQKIESSKTDFEAELKADGEAYKKELKRLKEESIKAHSSTSSDNNNYDYYDDYYNTNEGSYDEGYDKGHEDGYFDLGYDPEYENDDYMEGYEEGFSEGTSSLEEENQDDLEWEDKYFRR